MISLTNLKKLTGDMKSKEILRQKFEFQYKNKIIKAYYMIDVIPYIIIFGIQDTKFGFSVEVHRGFNVIPYIENIVEFKKILGIYSSSTEPYPPQAFFEHLNNNIPNCAYHKKSPKSHEYVHYLKEVEENDKIYFKRWLPHQNSGHVTLKNLDKTRLTHGDKMYLICKEHNISSCWSDKPVKFTTNIDEIIKKLM